MKHALLPIICLLSLSACGSGLQLTLVDAAHATPSNVAMFFTVDTRDGDPVPGLTAQDFRIYEDDRLVSVDESQQTIVNQEVAAEHFTLLLVDMSGSVTASDQVPAIVQAAQSFTAAVETQQKVAVYAFDGSEEIYPMQPFRRHGQSTGAGGVARLSSFRTRDPSTNLYGALVQAADVIDEAIEESDAALKFGTVVVFTDGSDRAARVTASAMNDRLDDAAFDVFAIGVGNEIDEATLADVGRSGYVQLGDAAAIEQAFEVISQRILGAMQRFYLLSYCSPARAGQHEVTVEAVQGELSGRVSYEFDAAGFGPRCNPARPPAFEGGTRIRMRRRGPARIEVRAQAQ
ncbi:MAG: VWA domain-containing protein [Deltaproteobacteria bacterium]|nr:VWA domain-containing protein [Deltaproteobacteria bacterium]